MSSTRLNQNQSLDRRRRGAGKPALGECALSLASALLLGCQTRGEFGPRNPTPPRDEPQSVQRQRKPLIDANGR